MTTFFCVDSMRNGIVGRSSLTRSHFRTGGQERISTLGVALLCELSFWKALALNLLSRTQSLLILQHQVSTGMSVKAA